MFKLSSENGAILVPILQNRTPQSVLDSMLSKASVETKKDFVEALRQLESRITLSNRRGGIGYLSSSLRHNVEREKLWTALAAKWFSQNEYHPLIVPIDAIYNLNPGGSLSLVRKVLLLDSISKQDAQGRTYAVILTGVSQSGIFTEEILDRVPDQASLRSRPALYADLLEFSGEPLHVLISRGPQGIANSHQVRLALGTSLLLQDRQTWQDLWYERSMNGGVPLYIVAPKKFHDAMNRLNEDWGHTLHDYHKRASYSLGSYDVPFIKA